MPSEIFVLILDDEPVHQRAIKRLLPENISVVFASSPEKAFATILAAVQPFSHIVSDRDMGVAQNGVEFLCEVYEHNINAHLALMSGGDLTPEQETALKRIGAPFFKKPVDDAILIAWIHS